MSYLQSKNKPDMNKHKSPLKTLSCLTYKTRKRKEGTRHQGWVADPGGFDPNTDPALRRKPDPDQTFENNPDPDTNSY